MMSKFKNLVFSALLSLGAFGAVTFTACTQDECKDVVCNNGGTCISGTCSCATGYEGNNCETLSRQKFVKQYTVTAACQNNTYVATIAAASGTDVTRVDINNLANLNSAAGTTTTVYANVSGNTITIPTQTVVGFSSATITASGSGTYTNGVLTMNYTIVAGSTTNNCTNTTWN